MATKVTKANYTTPNGYTACIGSVLQLSMVNPVNKVTALAYKQAMQGLPISGPFRGRGYMQRELGLAKAHDALVAFATEFGATDLIPAVGVVSHPGAIKGLGWPANWNLDAIGANVLEFSNPFEALPPVNAVADAALATMPANVDMLGDGEKVQLLDAGKALMVSTVTTSLALAEGFDIGSEPKVTSDTATFLAAKALVDADEPTDAGAPDASEGTDTADNS